MSFIWVFPCILMINPLSLFPRIRSDLWWSDTHLSVSCRRTGTNLKTWRVTSTLGTGSTTPCTASTSWPSTGSKTRGQPTQARRGESRLGASLWPISWTPRWPSLTSTGCPSGCSARHALSSEFRNNMNQTILHVAILGMMSSQKWRHFQKTPNSH